MLLYINDGFLIVCKPHGLPTVPLKGQEGSDTLLSRVGRDYPEVLAPMSDKPWEGGAVHRLDNDTSGLVLFARTPGFFNHIRSVQSRGLFTKTYLAVCSVGAPLSGVPRTISSYFRAYGPGRKRVKPETDPLRADSPVLYTTEILNAEQDGSNAAFTVSIARGFRHQIRAHLAGIGFPILGDSLYNPGSPEGELQLTCIRFAFPMPDSTPFSFDLPSL